MPFLFLLVIILLGRLYTLKVHPNTNLISYVPQLGVIFYVQAHVVSH
ncbi:MAG: hypothetical protein DID89_2727546702 [Candidatus Nitrotoga sp. CP45]|nr:MAG: hypothetical protein DID89_2727546702 [Candidatus Nitrotoga sp. CP45]